MSYNFQWLMDEDCSAIFVCSEMSGNTCGDHGLVVTFPQEESEQICYAGESHVGRMEFYSTTSISVWHLRRGGSFSIDCLFWCSSSGDLPEKHVASDRDEEAIANLVCTQCHACNNNAFSKV